MRNAEINPKKNSAKKGAEREKGEKIFTGKMPHSFKFRGSFVLFSPNLHFSFLSP